VKTIKKMDKNGISKFGEGFRIFLNNSSKKE